MTVLRLDEVFRGKVSCLRFTHKKFSYNAGLHSKGNKT